MSEVKLITENNGPRFQEKLQAALTDGWFPHFESFRLDGDTSYNYYAILLTRP